MKTAPAILFLLPMALAAQTYTTNFDTDENPLSEGGRWLHHDPSLTVVKTVGGVAFGTMTGYGQYDDSNGYLTGFGSDYSIEGTIYLKSGISSSPNREVELLLRWVDTGTVLTKPCWGVAAAKGYEINISHAGYYLNLGRFKDCDALVSPSNIPVPRNGDKFKATIQGQTITMHWNGSQVFQYTDNDAARRITTGNPGIGFYISQGAPNTDFGFTSVTVTALGTGSGNAGKEAVPSFSLDLNYPNPFRGATMLRYSLASPGRATLGIFDMSGRKVARLVNETRTAGVHTALFDGSKLPSGIYSARLIAGGLAQTRRIMLAR